MKRRDILLFAALFILTGQSARSQCPDRLTLLNRINFLKTSSLQPTEQLKELLPYVQTLETCPVDKDSVRIFLINRVIVLYYLNKDFGNSILLTKKSVGLLESKSSGYNNPQYLLKMYNYLVIIYDSLKQVKNKMEAIDSSVQQALRMNSVDNEILYNLYERTIYSFDIGDYARCLSYSELGGSLTEKYDHGDDSLTFMNGFFSQQINALIYLNKNDEAENRLLQKIAAFKKSGKESICGPFYGQLSDIHIQQLKYEEALNDLKNSLRCNRQINYLLAIKQSLNNIGFLYLTKLHDPATANRYFKNALGYQTKNDFERQQDIAESSNILGNIGNAYSDLGKFDSAFYFFQVSFDLLGKGTDENSLLEIPVDEFIKNPRIHYVTNQVRYKADAYFGQYVATKDKRSLDEALRIYKVADRMLTKVKLSQTELQSKLVWRSNARTLYEHAIRACFADNRTDDAFYFFEKSRAVLMNDQLNINSSMTREDLSNQSALNNKISSLKNKLADSSLSGAASADLQKEIFQLIQQKDQLDFKVSSKQRWNDEQFADSSQYSLQHLRKELLKDDRALLELFSGDSAVYIILIAGNKTAIKQVDKVRFDDLVKLYNGYISDPASANENYNNFVNYSHELYELIFDKVEFNGSRLIISPGDTYFPFESLITDPGKNSAPVYFIENAAVSYTYSGRFLLHDFEKVVTGNMEYFLGFAPVNYPARFGLADLSGSEGSVKKLSAYFSGSEIITGKAATKAEFLNKYASFEIVQLYTHASDSGSTGDPVIYFADSALYLSELLPVPSSATRLIILSACETAKGKNYEGEGIFSFNRAFAEAGVPSATVNLWSVDDLSAYRLSELFYKHLSRGMPSDKALQEAKIEFIKTAGREKALPFYWAPMILTGQVHTFAASSSIVPAVIWYVIILLVVIIAVIIGLQKGSIIRRHA
jgi:CHAT domain-containing protein